MGIELRTKRFGLVKDIKTWDYVPEEEGVENSNNTRLVEVEDLSRVIGGGHIIDEHEASAKYLRWKLSGPDTVDVQLVGESEGAVVIFESFSHVGPDLNHAKLSRRIDSHTTEQLAWTE